MVQAADPGHGPLHAETESRVRHAAVLAQIEVPLERVQRQFVLLDLRLQRGVVILALSAADDFPVALRREDVDAERHLGVLRILLEVERLHLRRITVHHHRPIELLAEDGLLVAAEIVAPLDRMSGLLNILNGFHVGDARERLAHAPERLDVPLEDGLQLLLVARQHRPHDLDDEVLGKVHVAVEIHVRDLRLDHPELRQVPAGLALLGTEGRAEDVRLSDGHRRSLAIELSGLGQERLAQIEVGHLEERGGTLARGGREDRGVHQGEPARVEVIADRLDDAVAHREDQPLPRRAQPEVPLLLQEPDAVLFRLDGVSRFALQHAKIGDVHLIADRAARILRDLASHLHRGLLRSLLGGGKGRFGDLFLREHALDQAGAVADLQKMQLAARALAVEPPPQDRFAAVLGGDVADVHLTVHEGGRILLPASARVEYAAR